MDKDLIIKKIRDFALRVFCLGVLIGIAFIPIFLIFKTVDAGLWDALCSGNQKMIVECVQKYDNKYGVIIIAILQVVQDISIVIPSAPIHISAGIVLGTWKGFAVCHIADVACNMFVFFLYTRIKKTIDKFLPIDESSRTVRLIKEGRSPEFMVVIACLMPAIPNGFIQYAAVNSKMKLKNYAFAVFCGAAIPTFVLTAVGDKIFEGNWMLMVGLLALSFVGVFFLLKYQAHIINAIDAAKSKIVGSDTKLNSVEAEAESELDNEV
jgi:uncharacterized membrane protein YdjX (TVP38/TMEM64 family)